MLLLCFIRRSILKPIRLNGNNLPWINSPDTVKHLGNTIENVGDFLSSDIRQKRAQYIQRNNELLQEFHFANPQTKSEINQIYNMSFSGSPLWDLFSEDVISLEKTYNTSLRLIWDIPRETHRYFLEPVSNQCHLKFSLMKRFLSFRNQIQKSEKSTLKALFSICQNDCRSVTGKNLRKIMLLCGKDSIESLEICDVYPLEYIPVP